MKIISDNELVFVCLIGCFFIGLLGGLALGTGLGRKLTNRETRQKLNFCIHAPTPIEIGDTLYIIRVYPINSQ